MMYFDDLSDSFQKDWNFIGESTKNPYDGLTWHMRGLDFDVFNRIAFEHFKNFIIELPELLLDLPSGFKIARTSNGDSLFPARWKTRTVSELAVLDIKQKRLIYYCLCHSRKNGVTPSIFHTSESGYEDVLSCISRKLVKYLLNTGVVILDSTNEHEGHWFWEGHMRECLKYGCSIFEVSGKDNRRELNVNSIDIDYLHPNNNITYEIVNNNYP
ncbi:hypothetical protein ACLHUW_13535 [Escherichia coli]|uniref:hypothetical protein n=1 Tax=Escherichia coli TaxID=562 RepID=UPI0010C3DA63|nr:hypothetical protein [Escherichia coli]EHS9976464.1 hypothetical protein [Escherichia coli]EKQ3313071.1 hypothetical protein [Escherichia coli]ELD0493395.1 hypothetical protein [Escherichia coli]ELT9870474.1 hypothetical protein [Escherichia coli]MXD87619.1 hypothetical protein [Escherichia coli]